MNPENKKKRIIYAWNYIEWGGAQVYFLALIKEVKKEFDVLVVLPKDSDKQLLKFINDLDVRCEFIAVKTDGNPARTLQKKIKRRFNRIRAERYFINFLESLDLRNSILHVELSPWQSLRALKRLAKQTAVFVTAHNSLPTVERWRYLLWKEKFKSIGREKNFYFFCSNEDSKNYFRQYFTPEFAEHRMPVTYTSVNPLEIDEALAADFSKSELCERFNIPKDKFYVLCVGQFIDRKGRWTFLDAAKRIFATNKEIAFVWISNSKPSEEDLRSAEKYGLGENFRLVISNEIGGNRIDLLKIFRLADVFVLASFVEGLPISLLEAMALGIPSISTNINAIPEAVKHLETGILIEAGDFEKLSEFILQLKSDENLQKKLSVNGRKFVLQKFDEREVAKIAIEAYNRAFESMESEKQGNQRTCRT